MNQYLKRLVILTKSRFSAEHVSLFTLYTPQLIWNFTAQMGCVDYLCGVVNVDDSHDDYEDL